MMNQCFIYLRKNKTTLLVNFYFNLNESEIIPKLSTFQSTGNVALRVVLRMKVGYFGKIVFGTTVLELITKFKII